MRIYNPNFVQPKPAKLVTLRAKLDAWFAANPSIQSVTVSELRAALPAESAGVSAAQLLDMARDAGWNTFAPHGANDD